MGKEEWMVMIDNMQKLHYFSRNMLLQNQRLTLRTAEMELMLLIYLKLGELTPLDVSQIMGMRKESVSRTLKSLLSKGYIEKVKCKEDERKYYLYLTDSGQEILNNDYQTMLRPIYYLREKMGEEFDSFIEMVVKANHFLQEFERSNEREVL